MNRPDFILRQFEFYELMNSPHPIYISDSSNEEKSEKLKNGIKKFKKLNITYQWAPPGKDCLYQLLPLVKEKYCIQMGDDDIMIPKTLSECADFLEEHPDYGTCGGKQVNIRFRREDYNNPFGIIERQTRPLGRSLEDEDMLVRIKNFWSDTFFIPFVVRRFETESSIRNITKHFSFIGCMVEFLLVSILITSGKAKTLDKLGYIMQINDNRYDFDYTLYIDFVLSPDMNKNWKICEEELSEVIRKKGRSREESLKIVKWLFIVFLAHQFTLNISWLPIGRKDPEIVKRNLLKELRRFISSNHLLKSIYYKFYPPVKDITRPESKYFNDFETVKDFLEKNR
jgi:glycosyltransferase domain-containing protein